MPASRSSGPRYAPEDPTLPKPWKELIDGNTGYHYFWNPETNVTQYERPADTLPPPPPLGPPPSAVHSRKRGDDDRHTSSRGHQSSKTSARGHVSSDAVGGGGGSVSAEAYRRQHEITITGHDVPAPFTTFESTGFLPEILREVHHAGFATPTPIQAQSWPIALRGRDVVAVAKTGSGKTLGYLFPGFSHLKNLHNNTKLGPTVLVLAPTRELATQIQDEAQKFGRSSRISCTCLYGGAPKGPQLRDLDRGVDVVVATPGRLNDILEMRRISLRQVSYLVLDEADRMLDMGFEPQIRKIVDEIPNDRQTLMFTATWPKEVKKIAADLLVNPVQVNIGGVDELVANKAITQYVEVITKMEKQRRLEQIIHSQGPHSKIIIFCSTKRMCDELSRTLNRKFGAAAIHGDKSQGERDRVLGQFRSGRSPILVATDVASRGLDIKDIRVVINFDFPTDIEDYVHRIGRTGRAGATGVAYTFFSDQDSKYASDLIKVLEGSSQPVPPELRDMSRRGGYGGKSFRRWGNSSARDKGRSHGGRNDSRYGGRGGWGLPSSGRSDGGRGVRGDSDEEPRDRYGRGPELGARDRHDVKVVLTNSDRRVRGRSFSPSPSPKKRRGELARSRSRSHSHSRRMDHGRNRTRSRSHSLSPGLNRVSGPARRLSPDSPPSKSKPNIDHHASKPVHSPTPTYDRQQRSPYQDGDGKDARHDPSASPVKERPSSPYNCIGNGNNGGRGGSASPAQSGHRVSPHHLGDDAEEGIGKGPVQMPLLCANNREEEEEGMIPTDEDETMITHGEGAGTTS